jgi:trimethylamine--corrinoid protein Co-methyltransferase
MNAHGRFKRDGELLMAEAGAGVERYRRRARRMGSDGPVARDSATIGPVRPGLIGGQYKPLSDHDLRRIHGTVLDVLENIGLANPLLVLREAALARGCSINEKGRLCFPRSLVEDIIAGAARGFVLSARRPGYDIDVTDARVHFAVTGQAVTVVDFQTKRYRPATLVDLYDFARLADCLEHVHGFAKVVVATDIGDVREYDINRPYACAAGTGKSFDMSFSKAIHIEPVVAMFDLILGGGGRFLKRPFCTVVSCPVVSPLCYGDDNSEVAVATVQFGIPIRVSAASQAGATAPAALAGALVQNTAEVLAGLLLVNLIRPGHPTVCGNMPFISDLRTGAFSGGGGEQAVLSAAAVQVAHFYDLPMAVGAGIADSKLPDNQAGYEKGVGNALAGLAGANFVSGSTGGVGSLMGACFESMVIDNEMLGVVQRAIRGIEVTEETLSYDVIKEAVDGPGHYLGAKQTLALMKSQFLYPRIADRTSPDDWERTGGSDIRDRARERTRELLSAHYPDYIEPQIDQKVRERFPIRLPREAMRPDNGRW